MLVFSVPPTIQRGDFGFAEGREGGGWFLEVDKVPLIQIYRNRANWVQFRSTPSNESNVTVSTTHQIKSNIDSILVYTQDVCIWGVQNTDTSIE